MNKVIVTLLLLIHVLCGCSSNDSSIVFDSELRRVTDEEYDKLGKKAYPDAENTMILKVYIHGELSNNSDEITVTLFSFIDMNDELQKSLAVEGVAGKGIMQDGDNEVIYDYLFYIDASELSEEEIKTALKTIKYKVEINNESGEFLNKDGNLYDLIEFGNRDYVF